MAQIASLPVIKVEMAFTPTDLLSLTQTWTDITLYVRDFNTHGGRQHYLDRIEASTLSMTLDNRTGFFFNASVNGTGAVIQPRLPVRISATWNSTTYTIFWGVIDTVDSSLADALNSDLYISASDSLKYLSLRYLWNETLYGTYVTPSGNARAWYQQPSNGTMVDLIGGYNGSVSGLYQLTDGVLLYSRNQALDLTNGTGNNTDCTALLPSDFTGGYGDSSIDFWVIGQALGGATLLPLNTVNVTPAYHQADICIDPSGRPYINYYNGTTYTSPVVVNDGYWHHIGVFTSGATLNLIVDGQVTTGPTASGYGNIVGSSDNFYHLGNGADCFIDQIVIGSDTQTNIKNRYVAGSLLRLDTNAADRIAQTLVIAGRGSIVSGVVTPTNYLVNGSAYSPGSASNGTVICQGTLSPLTTNTALDTIFEASDTEVGVFYQGDDGVLNFHTRGYIYRAAGNATPAYAFTDDTTSNYHYEASSLQLTRDDVDTWTTVIISPTNGSPQIYTAPTANQTRWGQSTLTKSSTGSTLEGSYQTAVYLGKVFASPLPRVNTMKLKSETDNGSNLDAMLGVNLQDRITVKRTPINPSAAGVLNTDMSVESINHEFAAEPGFWHTTYTLDPYPIRFSTQSSPTYFLIADDTTYGKSDLDVAL